MILSAVYGLWLYRKVVVGALENDLVKGLKDMNAREIMALLPLAFLTLLLGFYPSLVLDLSDVAVTQMLEPVQSHLVEANKIIEVVVREGGYNK
jgi:NADH-quinone oxidoreductase subunit M